MAGGDVDEVEREESLEDEVAWNSLGMSRQTSTSTLTHRSKSSDLPNFMFIQTIVKLQNEVLKAPRRHKPGYLLTAICHVSMVAMDGKRPDILFCLFFKFSQESLAAFK